MEAKDIGKGLSRIEREVIIRRSDSDNDWNVYTSSPHFANKLIRVAKQLGREYRIDQGGLVVSLPAGSVSIKLPRAKRILSDEQRTAIADRLAKGRQKGSLS